MRDSYVKYLTGPAEQAFKCFCIGRSRRIIPLDDGRRNIRNSNPRFARRAPPARSTHKPARDSRRVAAFLPRTRKMTPIWSPLTQASLQRR